MLEAAGSGQIDDDSDDDGDGSCDDGDDDDDESRPASVCSNTVLLVEVEGVNTCPDATNAPSVTCSEGWTFAAGFLTSHDTNTGVKVH